MCYSAMCYFQDSMGECKIRDYEQFKHKTGYKACIVGGLITSAEDEEYYNEHEVEFRLIRSEFYDMRLEWR